MDKKFILNLTVLIAYVVICVPLYLIHTAYYDYQMIVMFLLSGMLMGYSLRNIIQYHKDKKTHIGSDR